MTLKEWRESKGWSQNHLAKALSKKLGREVSQQNIHYWEKTNTADADVAEAVIKMSVRKVTFIAGAA